MKKIRESFYNYKKRQCKTWIGALVQLLVCNNLARLLFFLAIAMISSIIMSLSGSEALILDVLFFVGMGYSVIFGLILIVFAWIINPIRNALRK